LTVRKTDWDSLDHEQRSFAAFTHDGYPDMWTFQGEELAQLFMAERGGRPEGAMWGYRLPNDLPVVEEQPPFRYLNEMQAAYPGSWFICGFRVRSEGSADRSLPFGEQVARISFDPDVGAALLASAEDSAAEDGAGAVSCIVPLMRSGYAGMFKAAGFAAADERTGFHSLGESITWRLMVKAVRHG
jgi:hypothetical protein